MGRPGGKEMFSWRRPCRSPMQNAESGGKAIPSSFCIHHSAFIILHSLFLELPQRQSELRELLLDLVQARLAEVLAAQQLVLRAAGQLAQRVDRQPLERLAAADGQFQ